VSFHEFACDVLNKNDRQNATDQGDRGGDCEFRSDSIQRGGFDVNGINRSLPSRKTSRPLVAVDHPPNIHRRRLVMRTVPTSTAPDRLPRPTPLRIYYHVFRSFTEVSSPPGRGRRWRIGRKRGLFAGSDAIKILNGLAPHPGGRVNESVTGPSCEMTFRQSPVMAALSGGGWTRSATLRYGRESRLGEPRRDANHEMAESEGSRTKVSVFGALIAAQAIIAAAYSMQFART